MHHSFAVQSDQQINPFVVEGVSVTANEGNLVDSKSIALANGTRAALVQLISRLDTQHTHRENTSSIKDCVNKMMYPPSTLVSNYIFKSERMTSRSYSGVIDIVFDDEKVKSILNTCGFTYASTASGNTLIVPILVANNRHILSSEMIDNIWFKTWQDIPHKFGLMNFKVLHNDIFDAENVDAANIINGTYDDVRNLLQHYECDNIMIVQARDLNHSAVVVDLSFIGKHSKYKDTFKYIKSANEPRDNFMKRISTDLMNNTDAVWKRGIEKPNDTVFNSSVTVQFHNQREWHTIRSTLNKIDAIKQYKYKAIDTKSADLELEYICSPGDLSDMLLKNGIAVFQQNNKILVQLVKSNG